MKEVNTKSYLERNNLERIWLLEPNGWHVMTSCWLADIRDLDKDDIGTFLTCMLLILQYLRNLPNLRFAIPKDNNPAVFRALVAS